MNYFGPGYWATAYWGPAAQPGAGGGFFGPQFWGGNYRGPKYWGTGVAPAIVSQFFEQALEARLQALPGLVSLLGASAIFKTAVPQTWDFGVMGPALTYAVPTKTRGQVLTGSDGTAIANVQLEAFAYSVSGPKRILEAIFNGINGVPGIWGDGTCVIMSCVQSNETDQDGQPRAGSDQWLYHSIAEYHIKYRVSLPTLS